MSLAPGRYVYLKCLGTVPGPVWLDGRTGNGSVGLAPSTGGDYTGTRWLVTDGGSGAVVLKCLGTVPGPTFLNGITGNGSVDLAPSTNAPYSGTRWGVEDGGSGAVILQCLGTVPGPTFLNGITGNGSVDLAPSTNAPYSGTRWSPQDVPLNATIDQSDVMEPQWGGGPSDFWQSFTAGLTGLMNRLDLYVSSPVLGHPGVVTVQVYAGEGIGNGPPLATQTVTFQHLPEAHQPPVDCLQTCNFATPFQVFAGQKYTFRLTPQVMSQGYIYLVAANAYPRGSSNSPVGNTATVTIFRTWVMVP